MLLATRETFNIRHASWRLPFQMRNTNQRPSSPLSALCVATLATGLAGAGAFLATRAIVRSRRHFNLEGRVAIVTGGSRGIGLALAHELTRRGAKIVICARKEEELRAAQDELEQAGADMLSVICDVTQQDEIANVVRQTRDRFGRIDVLVNNAGTISVGPVSHMKLADYRDAMDTNFEGPLLFMLDVIPEMRKRGSGRIVNIASFGGKMPAPHMAPYSASKFALVGLSETLRTELADDGVYLTTVCPGLVSSGSTINAKFKGQKAKERAWFETGDNAPGITITPQQLARQVVNALQNGDAELVTPLPAKLAAVAHGLSGGISAEVIVLMNRLLPKRSTAPSADFASYGRNINEKVDPHTARRQRRAEEDNQR